MKISRSDLKQLFQYATSGTHFFFDGNFYDQIDGVAMGSPLGPVLANIFMGYHETKWLSTFPNSKVLLYRRYVDDIICVFNSEKDSDLFLNFLTNNTLI